MTNDSPTPDDIERIVADRLDSGLVPRSIEETETRTIIEWRDPEAPTRRAEERAGGALDVPGGFRLLDNQWGNPDADQGVWTIDDDRYGWDFDATGTTDGINYPEVFLGTRPWGSDTGVAEFPLRRGDVDEFTIDVDATYSTSDGEWDVAHEWWLLEEPPHVATETHAYEIMLLLDWGGGHDHGDPVATDLWTDRYGNTIDLWALYDSGGTSAAFYIFRIQGGHDGGPIDMARIVEWLTEHEGVSEDLLISGCELGTEYWPEARGDYTLNRFTVTVNGETYASGALDDTPDAPDTPESSPSDPAAPVDDSPPSPPAEDAPADEIHAGAVYRIENAHSGHVLAVADDATREGATLCQRPWDGRDAQQWRVIDNDDGTYRLENVHSGMVADVRGGLTNEGADVLQWSWHDGNNQRWKLVSNGDGTYRLENDHSGKVLDVHDASSASGANVQQWAWNHGANQRWAFVPVES